MKVSFSVSSQSGLPTEKKSSGCSLKNLNLARKKIYLRISGTFFLKKNI